LRADLIADAVLFLTNPKVVSAPLETKRKFLTQRKGMTEAEVDEAVRRSTSGTRQFGFGRLRYQRLAMHVLR
jgi:hypothetical protein